MSSHPQPFCDQQGKFFAPINNNTGCPYCPMVSEAKSQPEQKVKSHYGACEKLEEKIFQVQKHLEAKGHILVDPPGAGESSPASNQYARLCDASGKFFASGSQCRFCSKDCAKARSHFQACPKVQEYARALNSLLSAPAPSAASSGDGRPKASAVHADNARSTEGEDIDQLKAKLAAFEKFFAVVKRLPGFNTAQHRFNSSSSRQCTNCKVILNNQHDFDGIPCCA